MSAKPSLKLLAPAVLALGIAAVSLWPENASASVVFDFSGTCLSSCSGTATGVLTLTDAYVFGTDITASDFVSFQYSSSDSNYEITNASAPLLAGGLNSDGSLNASGIVEVALDPQPVFEATGQPREFISVSGFGDQQAGDLGRSFTFTNVTVVPEPSTWAMLVAGFGLLGLLGYAKTRGDNTLA